VDFVFIFCGRTMAMAAMGMVAAGGFSGLGYLNKKCPQGVLGLVFYKKKNPVFRVKLPKLHHLTVSLNVMGLDSGSNISECS
jgi:hypothetical protein